MKSWATASKVIKQMEKLSTWRETDGNHRIKLERKNQMFAFDVLEEDKTTKVLRGEKQQF